MAQTQCNEGQANPVVRVGKEKNETNTHCEKNRDGTFTWKTKHDMRTAKKKLPSPCPAPLRIIGSCTHVVNSLFSLSCNYKRVQPSHPSTCHNVLCIGGIQELSFLMGLAHLQQNMIK